MLLAAGAKLLVVHRRLFERDQGRYFIGVVEGYEPGIAKVRGRTWTRDEAGEIVQKKDERTKLLALASGTLIVYQLPSDVDLSTIAMRSEGRTGVRVVDGRGFEMDLSEGVQG